MVFISTKPSLRAKRTNLLRLPRLRAEALQRVGTSLPLLAMTVFTFPKGNISCSC
jgi:hypothetical protein